MKKIHLIAGIQKSDRGIGFNGDLVFKLREDMRHFVQLTTGNIIVMGRKTFESMNSKPLPNRTNIVITRDTTFTPSDPSVIVAHSLDEALEKSEGAPGEKVFVIGGGEIYSQALPKADTLDLTIFESVTPRPADTFFPDYSDFKTVISEEKHEDPATGLSYTFLTLAR